MATSNTFRFTFSSGFKSLLEDFSSTHKNDDSEVFNEAWNTWKIENKDHILREHRYLSNLGYTGNIENKMYISAKYYLKNKKEKTKPRKRRPYIGVDRDVLDAMDAHLTDYINEHETIKPSVCYKHFRTIPKYVAVLEKDMIRLREKKFSDNDIENKFKKTYKNRHFNICKRLKTQ